MDAEFAELAGRIADEAARCSINLHEARRLLALAVDFEDVAAKHPDWVHAVEKHLRGPV